MISHTSEIHPPTVVLHRPQIPQNTGNISRLCVAVKSPLVLTGRLGFDVSAASVRRAGLDHWENLDFTHYRRFAEFMRRHKNRRIVAVTKAGKVSLFDFRFATDDILLFGNETMGLPPSLIGRCEHTIAIPMWGKVRSLNLSNSVAICVYEYLRQVSPSPGKETYARTFYRKTSGQKN